MSSPTSYPSTPMLPSSLVLPYSKRQQLSCIHPVVCVCFPRASRKPLVMQMKSVIFPETICKAGWNKEQTIDALYRKAGYWKPRGKRSHTPPPPSSMAASPDSKDTTADYDHDHDPVVSRTAVFLRFETVSFRLGFRKYQRAKAAANLIIQSSSRSG